MPSDLALVDTNVLVYAHYEDADQHQASQELLNRAQAGDLALCIAPQVVAEFYAVVTNPRRVSSAYTSDEALDALEQVLTMPGLALLPTPVDIASRLVDLLRKYPATGGSVFDVQLVAAMLANGVTRIYTFDESDFERFDEIEVLTP